MFSSSKKFELEGLGEEVHYLAENGKLFLDCHICHGCFQANFHEAKKHHCVHSFVA